MCSPALVERDELLRKSPRAILFDSVPLSRKAIANDSSFGDRGEREYRKTSTPGRGQGISSGKLGFKKREGGGVEEISYTRAHRSIRSYATRHTGECYYASRGVCS